MPTHRSRQRSRRSVALGLAGVAILIPLVAASCGDEKDDSATPKVTVTTTAAPETSAPPTTAAGPQKIAVVAKDYSFEGIPSTVAVGSEFSLSNESTKEVHEIIVFRLPDTETRSVEDLAKLPMAQLQGALAGAPTMVLVAPPTQAGFNAVGDGTIGKAGNYIAFCAIPTGADPAAYMAAAAKSKGGPVEVPGGEPHYMEGMVTGFTVK